METNVKYSKVVDLESFLAECELELLHEKNRRKVIYPSTAVVPWDSESIKPPNEELLKAISGNANVYAIFIANNGEADFHLAYIGQSNSKGARTRLTNHLIKKHKKTGAKLGKVIDHVQSGGKLKVSWISINPVSLRHYIEEELIAKHRETLIWNKHGKKKHA